MNPRMLAANGEDTHTVLAVFGNTTRAPIVRKLFDITRKFIKGTGFSANVLAVHTTKRYGRSKPVTSQLVRSMESDDLTGFALGFIPLEENDGFAFSWLEGATTMNGFTVTGRTNLLPASPGNLISLVLEISGVFPFIYGYQYVIDAAYGPGFHAVGMFYSSHRRKDIPEFVEPERRRTTAWSIKRDRIVAIGTLRDVFPINLLTNVHRSRLVNGIPLFDWIGQDNSRGRLEELSPTLWAWQVPDERCIELGDTLESAGLLASSEGV